MATSTHPCGTFLLPRAVLTGLALLAALALAAAGCRPSPPPPKPKPKPAATTPAGSLPPRTGAAQEEQREMNPWDHIREVLTKAVSNMSDPAVAAWADEGGVAQITFFGNTLVVAQTPAGLKKVDDLVRALDAKSELKIEQTVALSDGPEEESLGRMRELLAEKIDLDLADGTTVPQLADLLNKRVPGLNVVVSEGLAGAAADLKVRLKGKREDAVEQILKDALPAELAYTVVPGCVLMVPHEAQGLKIAFYRLVAKPDSPPPGEGPDFFDDIKEVITRNVSNMSCPKVAAWADEGGPAVFENFPRNILIVTQTEEGHRRTAALLDGLVRVGGLKGVTRLAVTDPDEPPEKGNVLAALRQPMDISVKEEGLDKVLKLIGQQGPSVYIDPDIAAGGVDLSVRVVDLDLKQVPVDTLLDLILGADLGYKVEPGYVMITTKDKLQQELPLVLYKVEPGAQVR